MVKWVIVTLNREDVLAVPLGVGTDLEDGEGVCVEENPSRIFGEHEADSSGIYTVLHGPVSNRIGLVEGQVLVEVVDFKVPG